jgi:hypothetical protein
MYNHLQFQLATLPAIGQIPVFNRTVTLRYAWAKIAEKGK